MFLASNVKKIGAGLVALLLGISVATAQEFSFTNELSSDVVTIDNIFDDDTSFAGITENASFEFTSEKLDAGVMVEFTLGTGSGNGVSETDHLNFAWTDLDYYLDFRPVSFLTIAFHDDLWMEGSYLPLWDDNVAAGGLGSSGFSLMFEPIDGLRIAATVPLAALEEGGGGNFFNGKDDDDEDNPFNIGFGVDYTFGDLFSVGAKVGDVADGDEISFGVFGMVMPLQSEQLIFRLGFSHYEGGGELEELDYSENITLSGKNIYNFSVEFNGDALSVAAEIAGDTDSDDDEETPYDMYIGASIGYAINDNLSIALSGQCFLDFASDNAKPLFGFEPSITFATENHEFSIGADLEFCDGDVFVKFPISWVYSF